MKNKKPMSLELNAGTGMALGVALGAVIAAVVDLTTGYSAIWTWAIPVGVACGLAIGAGKQRGSA